MTFKAWQGAPSSLIYFESNRITVTIEPIVRQLLRWSSRSLANPSKTTQWRWWRSSILLVLLFFLSICAIKSRSRSFCWFISWRSFWQSHCHITGNRYTLPGRGLVGRSSTVRPCRPSPARQAGWLTGCLSVVRPAAVAIDNNDNCASIFRYCHRPVGPGGVSVGLSLALAHSAGVSTVTHKINIISARDARSPPACLPTNILL